MPDEKKPVSKHIEDSDLEKVSGGGRELPPSFIPPANAKRKPGSGGVIDLPERDD